uniref:NADH-ubiquinone oxidoreductase chain 5 n=1 Tax=Liocranchia reinhardtii TaxID=2749104 RepID=A0AA50KUE5_9MOLL|nr:NADH dehydrogenase subunit 5 [Liocranchia reinhardtii]WMC20840.1 NADH dehydrogenase subunit 5 [Liocranchia reinhardtii]
MFSILGMELCFSIVLFSWCFMMIMVLIYLCMNNICLLFSWELFNCMSSSVEFDLAIDWMSCSFSGLVCFISGCVMIFTISYMSGDSSLNRFTLTVMLFVLSMNFLIFIPSLISLLLGWDGLGLVSFCLVIYYQNSKSLSAGMLTVLMNRVGDCFILGSISMIVVLGHWNMLCLWEFDMFMLANLFIMIAGMTKSAQIPFSSWLPAAMAAPTPVSALVHSSTLVTAGVFLFIRFFKYLNSYEWFSIFMVYVSILTTIMSGVCALYEYDMKKIIALSTLSQLGVMMMSLGLGMPMLALFHLYTHAMFKALLFMCGGNIIHCFSGKQDMRQMSNVSKLLPVTTMFLNISNMALCGLPFLGGFYSKDLIIESLISGNMNLVLLSLGLFGVCLTVLYSMRFSFYTIWCNESSEVYSNMNDGDLKMIFPMSMLVMGALWGGFIFQSLFCQFSVEFFFPTFMKLFVPILIVSSLLMSFGFWDKGSMTKNFGILNYINSSMWFLSSFICYPMMNSMKSITNSSLKVVDMGWFEIVGGQGLFSMNKVFMYILEHWLIVMFNCYLVVFVLMVFII